MTDSSESPPVSASVERLLPLTPLSHAILIALAGEDLHGYAIVQEVERQTEGAVRPGTGTLYAALRRLEADALIADSERRAGPEEDARRKYYRLTERGRAAALAEAARLERVLKVARSRGLRPERAS